MAKIIFFSFLFSSVSLFGQAPTSFSKYKAYVAPELLYGMTAAPNDSFPSTNATTAFIVSVGKRSDTKNQEWAYRLNYPKTGVSFGVTDFGNSEFVGQAFSAESFIEYGLFKNNDRISMQTGLCLTYFNKKYDPITNPYNRGVTTNLTWSFKMFFYYEVLQKERYNLRLGGGYRHQSNGHTKLPNQGFNSFLAGISSEMSYGERTERKEVGMENELSYSRSVVPYLSVRGGIGQQAFALAFNDRREVYTLAISAGKTYNKTLRVGAGVSYRFYEHYYDYIKGNESLVQDGREFESYKENPFYNASNLAVFGEIELLLNHVAFDVALGFNVFKPAYKIDYRINEGWDNPPRELPESWMFGEFTTKYKLKQYISSKLGIKYYLVGTDSAPKHNMYVGAHLNANLGQADFTELSLGYVYAFGTK